MKGTKYGISAHQFPDLDIVNITEDQAIQIYTTKYWHPLYSDIESQPVVNKIFDLGVLFGEGTAVGIAQRILHMVTDEIFGPHTLVALNEADPTSFIKAYKTAFVSHAIGIADARPSERKDLPGWITRINS